MSEQDSSNRIVGIVIVGALLLLTGVVIWSRQGERLDAKKELQQQNNVRSQLGEGRTEDISSGDKIRIPVPPFRFSQASGGTLGLEDLKGKVWVAQFIFTNCAGFCPEMSKQTELLQERTKDLPDLHFVSFTVDPERDTLEALKEYSAEYRANDRRWHFLRASQEEIHRLGRDGFMLLNDTDALIHSKQAALVDRQGNIRGFFDGAGPERVSDFKALEALARKLYVEDGNQ